MRRRLPKPVEVPSLSLQIVVDVVDVIVFVAVLPVVVERCRQG